MKSRRAFRVVELVCFPILVFILGGNAIADYLDNPDPIPGWTHPEPLSRDTEAQHGIILSGADVGYSATVIAEIDGNSSNGLEVAVAGADGAVYVFLSDGTLLWQQKTTNADCKSASSGNRVLSSPAVGELFGDGMPYVLVGYGGVGGGKCDGGVIAFQGSNGKKRWDFNTKKFGKKAKFGANIHSVFSTPALADTDGDGKLEVGFGSFDRNVYLLNANGSLRWYYNAADTIWSSAAFVNVDDDSELEMIIGTDISGNSRLKPPTFDGGYVYAFKTTNRKKKHIPFRDPTAFVWKAEFDQVIYSAPVVADVMPDSPGEEIIVGSGCFFPQRGSDKRGKWFKVLRASDGKVLQTLPTQACSTSSPAIGDIDEDGQLEIVVTVNGFSRFGGDGASRVMAWKASSTTPIWEIIPKGRGGDNDAYGGNFISPVIADVDGNGSLEVVVANGTSVGIYAGKTGAALTCQSSGCDELPTMLYAWDSLKATPSIGDINLDGALDIIVAGGHSASRGHGVLYGWTYLSDVIDSEVGIHPINLMPWPMYRGNSKRSAHNP